MNCRAFHKNLEDYLQDGLDFPNRFAIERHARECIGCGKDLADAIELRRMVLDLTRVQAPADFEFLLFDKIGMSKAHGRFSAVRRFWIYGPECFSWKKLMVASSSLAILVIGTIVSFHRTTEKPAAPPSVVARQPEKVEEKAKLPAVNAKASLPAPVHASASAQETLPIPIIRMSPKAIPASTSLLNEYDPFEDPGELPFDFLITGKDVRPAPVRVLPKKIRIQYIPASEEYFIHYVSH
jgi:hypothetical protein